MANWGHIPLVPRFNVPETFGKALSYEGQIHALCTKFGEITDSYNDTLEYINSNFPWKFANPIEWSNNRVYEPYTVVYDTNTASSYVSLKEVPIGIPLTNTEYWAKTADYNAQVERATTRSIYYGKKILCVTDSWGNENVHGVTTSWMHLVCNWLGADYIDLHQGSTGFIAAPTYQTRLQNWINSHSSMTSDIAYIFVTASINDHAHTHTEISSAVGSFIDYARQSLPNVTIVLFGFPVSPNPYVCSVNESYNSWAQVASAIDYFMAINPGKPRTIYVPQTFYSLVSDTPSYLMDDAIHPNQAGHTKIARFAYQALTCEDSKQIVKQTPVIKITENNETFTNLTLSTTYSSITIDDNVLNGCTKFRLAIPSNYTITSDSKFVLNIPYIMPVSRIASATYDMMGTATICDESGNVAIGFVNDFKRPYNVPDNSSDDSNIWMLVVPNRDLTHFSGIITVNIEWHISLTINNATFYE